MKIRSLFLLLQLAMPNLLWGNDGNAEVALGGIRLKAERRVALLKERLFISKKVVRVDYEFMNESDQDLTTEVAFPIPEYRCDLGNGWAPVEDFKVWIDGTAFPYSCEEKAYVDGKEVTAALVKDGISIATFGDLKEGGEGNAPIRSQLLQLPVKDREHLAALGAIDGVDMPLPLWTVRKTYHWTQTFPARAVVRIRHMYSPVAGGFNNITLDALQHPTLKAMEPAPGCPDPAFRQAFTKAQQRWKARRPDMDGIPGNWVRYILTTANTWKTPIQDFELEVERDPGELVTFCWNGKLEKTAPNTFRSRMVKFVPTHELTVYFLQP